MSRPSYKTTSAADLPETFPGCWRRRTFKRAYMRVWKRLKMRNDSAYREAHCQRSRAWRAIPENRRRGQKACRAWNRTHKSYWRLRWRRTVRRVCFFCHGPAKPGRYCGMRRVERLVEDGNGGFVRRVVNWCGRC